MPLDAPVINTVSLTCALVIAPPSGLCVEEFSICRGEACLAPTCPHRGKRAGTRPAPTCDIQSELQPASGVCSYRLSVARVINVRASVADRAMCNHERERWLVLLEKV